MCLFPMVISSKFRMRRYRDDDHWEGTPLFRAQHHFENLKIISKKVYIWAAEFHTGRIQMVHHLIFKKQHNLAACSILRGLIICKIGAFRLGVKHANYAMHSKKTIIYYQSYKFRQPQFFLHSFRYS